MPSDPTECRENAACWVELAVAAKTEHLKVMLVELSRRWEKLAIDLENVLDTIEFRDLTRRCDALAIQLLRLHRVVGRKYWSGVDPEGLALTSRRRGALAGMMAAGAQVLRLLVLAIGAIFRPKALLIAENLCLRQQLVVLQCCSVGIRGLAWATPIGAFGFWQVDGSAIGVIRCWLWNQKQFWAGSERVGERTEGGDLLVKQEVVGRRSGESLKLWSDAWLPRIAFGVKSASRSNWQG
jgi:hypothetical protein